MKKILALVLVLSLALAVLAGCGSSSATTTETAAPAADTKTTDTTATETVTKELTPLVVGASSTPHAEILEAAKATLAAEGFDLQIVVYDDYVLPNTALEDGDLDANYFQHTPYLNSFNASNGTHLVSAALIHYEPFGIYSKSVTDLSQLAAGATIIIPADDSNETRALLLLQQEGLIVIADGHTVETGVTTFDIADNGGYNIVAVQADSVSSQLANADEGTIAVINGNYALEAGYTAADALALEDASGDAALFYANIIAVREGEENSDKTQALINAIETVAVKSFIEETYSGSVLPVFTPVDAETVPLVVGASSTPHAEILEFIKDDLAAAGYELQIVVFDDYVLPNTALEDGELDANYFQHTPYLNSFNASNGTHLVSAALVHYEPFGIYSKSVTDLSQLAAGATIIIPADDSNETRALLLLQQEGLITVADGYTVETGITTLDIADNGGYNIVAVQADSVASQLANADEGTIAVINGNYALEAGYTAADALALEDASGDAALFYANIIAVREGEEDSAKTKALIKALQTDAVKAFIEETYNGSVVTVF